MSKLRTTLVFVLTLLLVYWAWQQVQTTYFIAPAARTGVVTSPDGSSQAAFVDNNYTRIEPALFMGGYVSSPPDGVQAVLNLCEFEDQYQVPHHRWTPIPDTAPAPSLQWLRENVEFVAEQQRLQRPTYVHCHAGISRAGMVMTAYLMQKHNWSRDEALAYIRKSRPVVSPNPAFMELLNEWESAK